MHYYLPADVAIDVDGVIDAMLDENVDTHYMMDIKTGDVVTQRGDIRVAHEERYIPIVKVPLAEKKRWMGEFMFEMIRPEDVQTFTVLLAILKERGLKGVIDLLEQNKKTDGWIHGWVQWEHDCVFDFFEEWTEGLPVPVVSKWKGCDDCELCKAMENGAGIEELHRAFEVQNQKQAENSPVRPDELSVKTVAMVEQELQQLLSQYVSLDVLSIATVKEWVLHDDGDSAMDASNRFLMKWTPYFQKYFDDDSDELDRIFTVFNDAWNYFPHNSLEGRSPEETYRKLFGEEPDVVSMNVRYAPTSMPNMIVGDSEMSWEEYETMIAKMEQMQQPFKTYIEQKILPQYKQHLEERYSAKTVEKHHMIADILFERALYLGFVDMEHLCTRPEFIYDDFPHWWQTHVMFSSLTENQIVTSLKKLFTFLNEQFGIRLSKNSEGSH